MRVHLIRSADFSAHTYQSVLQIVRLNQGPVEFLASESDAHISNAIEVEIESKEAFEKAKESREMYSISNSNRSNASHYEPELSLFSDMKS